MDFPYADRFSHYLKHDRLLADNTINDINHDVADLFNYLRHFRLIVSWHSQTKLINVIITLHFICVSFRGYWRYRVSVDTFFFY